MQRTIVQITRIRIADAVIGDVVGSDPDGVRGWFEVEEIVLLINGDYSVVGDSGRSSITAAPNDVIGLQVQQVVDIAPVAA